MATTVEQRLNPDRFDARNWMGLPLERAAQPPTTDGAVAGTALIILSGVVLTDFRGGANWKRDRLTIGLSIDFASAFRALPFQVPASAPPNGGEWALWLQVSQWSVSCSLNARSNDQTATDDGSAVDRFGLVDQQLFNVPGASAQIYADLAARDIDGWVLRIGYLVHVYGQIVLAQVENLVR
jgi:hypothetical protein